MRSCQFLLVMLLFLAGRLEAKQQVQVHALSTGLSESTSDSAKARNYASLSTKYLAIDQQKALVYAQKALQFAVAANNAAGKVNAWNALGAACLATADHKKAVTAYKQVLQISTQAGNKSGVMQAYISLGNAYFKAAAHNSAVKCYLAAATYAQQLHNMQEQGNCYALTGSVYEHRKDYRKALTFYLKAAGISEQTGNTQEWAVRLVHSGVTHIHMGQPEKALPYMLQALQLHDNPQGDTLRLDILQGIAEAYRAMYNHKTALRYALQSYEMAEGAESAAGMAASASLLQAIYADMQDYKLAYHYQAISAAQAEALQAIQEEEKLATLAKAYEAEIQELATVKQHTESENLLLWIKQKLFAHAFIALAALATISLLLLFFVFRRRLHQAKRDLQDAREQLQARNYKIRIQREELAQQSVAFQQQNEQLERHNNFKSKIFSIISHDLRSPFASVKGVLNLVQKKPMSEAGIKYLFGLLSKDMDVTLNMLNNLLVWSKAQLEGAEVMCSPVDVQLLTAENIELASLQAGHKNIQITNRVKAGIFVLADKEKVNFVLRNLLMNALKFTFEGGEITVTANELGDTVTIAVHDNGQGISEENQARLFTKERFTTIGTSSEKGTGLGLMLCKEFIESMNGRIGVESQEGKGSTFYFTLRKAAVQTSAGAQKRQLA